MMTSEETLAAIAKCWWDMLGSNIVNAIIVERVWVDRGNRYAICLEAPIGQKIPGFSPGWYCFQVDSKGQPEGKKSRDMFGKVLTNYTCAYFSSKNKVEALNWINKAS